VYIDKNFNDHIKKKIIFQRRNFLSLLLRTQDKEKKKKKMMIIIIKIPHSDILIWMDEIKITTEKLSESRQVQDSNVITLFWTKETEKEKRNETHTHTNTQMMIYWQLGKLRLCANNNVRKKRRFVANECMTDKEEVGDTICPSLLCSFKVIVNRRNNVPFRFGDFYNDHVPFVILLKKSKKIRKYCQHIFSTSKLKISHFYVI